MATRKRRAPGGTTGAAADTSRVRTAKQEWSDDNRERLARDDNILGIGVGLKETAGIMTGQMAVKYFVRQKRDVPTAERLPATASGMPTDVVQMAPLRARGSYTQRVRPGVGGCSGCVVVQDLTYTGTLGIGMRGYGGLAGRTLVLSNNHVLANENRSRIGDPVIQPGSLDGGSAPDDVIGHLYEYVPLRFAAFGDSNPPVNRVDAACAEISRFGEFTREIFWIGYPRGWKRREDVEAALADGNTGVQKTGRTTGFTTGTIAAVGFDGWVGYDSGDAYFEDQLLITPGSFSDAGDSGSCILDLEENIVGLLFAGGATHTVANFIEDVWSRLGPIDFSDPLR